MEVFFGNLPGRMSAFELRRIVNSAMTPTGMMELAKSMLSVHEKIKRLEFDVISEQKAERIIHYGKAVIEPDHAATRIIEKLDNFPCRGSRLKVREFRNRSYSNDRRSVHWREKSWEQTERRVQERRVAGTIQKD